jgi:hypothetical protein
MAKVIFTKAIGGDGAAVTVGTDDNGNLVVGATYPLSKITGPIDQALDDLTAKIESALGNAGWAKAIFDPLDAAAKAEIEALING